MLPTVFMHTYKYHNRQGECSCQWYSGGGKEQFLKWKEKKNKSSITTSIWTAVKGFHWFAGGQAGREAAAQTGLPAKPKWVETTWEHLERAWAEDGVEGARVAKPQQQTWQTLFCFPKYSISSTAFEKARKEPRALGNTIHPYPVTTKGLLAQEGINNLVTVPASTPLKTRLISHHLL